MSIVKAIESVRTLWFTVALIGLTGTAAADDACAICDREIVTNSELATCFLDQYGEFAKRSNGAIAVDLSFCETSRSVVEALALPTLGQPEPNLRFLLSRTQLDCLKRKLEEPGLVLDPQARIELESCG